MHTSPFQFPTVAEALAIIDPFVPLIFLTVTVDCHSICDIKNIRLQGIRHSLCRRQPFKFFLFLIENLKIVLSEKKGFGKGKVFGDRAGQYFQPLPSNFSSAAKADRHM